MFLNHAELESCIHRICTALQADFDGDWLLYPGCDRIDAQTMTDQQVATLTPLFEMHRSLLFEFCYVLEGTAHLLLEDRVLRLRQGQVCLVPAGTLHVEMTDRVSTGTTAFFVFLPSGVSINQTITHPGGSHTVLHGQSIQLDPLVYNLALRDMAHELQSSQHGADTLIKCTLLQQLISLQRTIRQAEHRMSAEEWKQSIVREVIGHLHNSPTGTLEVNDLADHCAVSANHLNSIFKSITGSTIAAYSAKLRIHKAKQLLETTDMKLRQLAEELGYYDQYHFCKAFKKATGMSPSQYRQEKTP